MLAIYRVIPSLILFLLLYTVTIGQTGSSRDELEMEINSLFQQKKFYHLLSLQDNYYQTYPEAMKSTEKDWIWAQRAYAWLALYDLENLRSDLKKMEAVNPSFIDKWQFRFFIDDKYVAEFFSESYMSNVELDPARDYRPRLNFCDTVRGTLGPTRSCYDVNFYDLHISILPEERKIEGLNRIFLTFSESVELIQIDLFDQFNVNSISMDGLPLDFTRSCNAIFINLKEKPHQGQKSCLEIDYSGIPGEAIDPPWNGGFVWKTNKGRHWAGVACEHLGASSWWPVKDHLSDKPDSMRITLTVPESYQAISNGNLRSFTMNEDKTNSFEWFINYPVNSYNVTFYLGDFVNFNEQYIGQGEAFQVDYYVLKKHLKKAKKYYAQTTKILEVFGDIFGEYPFTTDGAGYVEAPYTGMEHQGAIAIGDEYGKECKPLEIPGYDLLVVHETAHEWWGNALAIDDMADAWINEGFATYAEWLFIEKVFGYQKYLEAFGIYSQNIINSRPLVGDYGVNDNSFVTGDIYTKGAAMLNNLRCIINNDSLFFRIIKDFYNEYKMEIVGTQDFISFVGQYYQADLSSFFDVFLYQDNPPVLEYTFTLAGGTLLFNYRWTGVGKDFTMPFSVIINDSQCITLTGTTSVQRFIKKGADSFLIPTPFSFNVKCLEPNSFTYFQTHYVYE